MAQVILRLRLAAIGSGSPVEWIRLVAAAVVPLALVVRTALDPLWWVGRGPVTIVVVAGAVLLAMVGLRWLAWATQRPRALSSRRRVTIRTADEGRAVQVDAAARLLSGLADEARDQQALWSDFGQESGLNVPVYMRPLISSDMQPGSLIRYLSVRSREPVAAESPLWVVLTIPLVACVLPAVLVIAAV